MHKIVKKNTFFRLFIIFIALFSTSMWAGETAILYAQSVWNLPVPGILVDAGPVYAPVNLQGIIVHPDDPFRFNFLIDTGDDDLSGQAFQDESRKLIKFFLAAITIPDEDFWVNLSPEESDRIIPAGLGETEIGMEMLAQDYLLKQITSSFMFPESEIGKTFWKKVFAKAQELYGTTDIPVDTFNKVWIVPGKAVVYEDGPVAVVQDRYLKVMLEEDYRMEENSLLSSEVKPGKDRASDAVAREIIREIIIPELEYEVNNSEAFAPVRQIYNAAILAQWFKKRLKDSLLGTIYMDQNKTQGIAVSDPEMSQKIYDQYVAAFQKGVYNFIREDMDSRQGTIIPRKYFSGGIVRPEITITDASLLNDDQVPSLSQPESGKNSSPGNGRLMSVETDLTTKSQDVVDDIRTSTKNSALSLLGLASLQAMRLRGALEGPVDEALNPDRSMLSFDIDPYELLQFIVEKMTTLPSLRWEDIFDPEGGMLKTVTFISSWVIAGMAAKWTAKKFFGNRFAKAVYTHLRTQTIFGNRWALDLGGTAAAYRAGEFFIAQAENLSPRMADKVLDLMRERIDGEFGQWMVPMMSAFYRAVDREPGILVDILKKQGLYDSSPSKEIAHAIVMTLQNFPQSLVVYRALEEVTKSSLFPDNEVKVAAQKALDRIAEEKKRIAQADEAGVQAVEVDSSLLASEQPIVEGDEPVGGIDLRLSALKVEVKRDQDGRPLPIVQQDPALINVQGFTPVIIQVVPANMNLILGTNKETAASWPKGVLKQS